MHHIRTRLALLLFSTLIPVLTAAERTILARFEVLYESGMGMQRPREKKVVTFYYSAPSEPRAADEKVQIETQRGTEKRVRTLSFAEAGPLLDTFDDSEVPNINYQLHFDQLPKREKKPHRGVVTLTGNSGQQLEVFLHPRSGDIRFRMWDVNATLYIYSDDAVIKSISRLIDACKIAASGSDALFLKD